MKTKGLKIRAALLLLAVALTLNFTACSSKGDTAMRYGDAVITERMYEYWVKQFRDYVLSSFSGATDDAAFWGSEVADGTTMSDYALDIAQANVKKNLVCMKLFDDYALKLSEESVAAVEADMKDLIESYGSKPALNAALADYGINAGILKEIYLIQEKITAVFEYMKTNALVAPTDDEVEAYYLDHYARIKYLTFTLSVTETGADGNTTSRSLTDAEKAAKEARIAEAMEKLAGGADFDAVMAEYNEYDMTGYENGVYISTNNTGYEIIAKALAMDIGATERMDTASAVYVVRRLPLETKPYLDDAAGQFSDLADYVADEVFQNMLTEAAKDITVDDAVVARYPIY